MYQFYYSDKFCLVPKYTLHRFLESDKGVILIHCLILISICSKRPYRVIQSVCFPILFIDFNSIARAYIFSWENCVSYLCRDNFFGTQWEGISNGYTSLVRIINPSPNTSILFLCKDWYWHPTWTRWLYDASFKLCSPSWCWSPYCAFCALLCILWVNVIF